VSSPHADFQIAVPAFEGALDDLLVAIAQNRVVPEALSMSTIAGQLAAHCAKRGDGELTNEADLEETGRLVAVVARIMLRKSAQLLVRPVDEEADAAEKVARRQTMDREALGIAVGILAGSEGQESFAPVATPHLVDRPLEPRSSAALPRAWSELWIRAARAKTRVTIPAFVRLETAVSGLVRRLRVQGRISFGRLLDGADRNEAVVHFLAVLELVRRRQATTAQAEIFGDILVEYVESGAAEASRAG
jgi:chromatin segregation and condensation protein Rec8/ScpA/Scc1 (kleisin family)